MLCQSDFGETLPLVLYLFLSNKITTVNGTCVYVYVCVCVCVCV
jgi:hypothetical protein